MQTDLNFQKFFVSQNAGIFVFSKTLHIVAATDLVLAVAMRSREKVVGNYVFDTFPDNPNDPGANGVFNLRASLDRVLKTRVSDTMPFQKYDIAKPAEQGGGFEERWWSPKNSPLLNAAGEVEFIIHEVKDVTEEVRNLGLIAQSSRALAGENHLRLITDRLPAMISYTDTDSRYRFVNAAYSKWFGVPRESIEGKTREELVKDSPTYHYMRPFEKRALAGESVSFDLTLTRADGSQIDLDTELIPDISPETGKVRGIIGVGHDVTARNQALKEAEQAREELYAIFAQAALPMCILTGPEFRFTLANPHYLTLSGRDVLGRTLREVFAPSEVDYYLPILEKVYHTGTPVFLEEAPLRLPNKEGVINERLINVGYHPYRGADGQPAGILAVLIDVTESARARIQVERLASELKEAVNARDEFMSIASHELKTPITSLKLQLQLTQRRLGGENAHMPTPEKLKSVVETSMRQVDRLTDLVEGLLDIARIQAGKLEYSFSDFNLRAALNDVIERFSDQLDAAKNTLSLVAPDEINVRWDRFRIEQVLVNLISNAIKYAPQKPIEIRVNLRGNNVEMIVSDQGPGIPKERQDKIFERFERATSSRNISGLGLGLFIAKQVVTQHGGTIEVQSELGHGTMFKVKIPASR